MGISSSCYFGCGGNFVQIFPDDNLPDYLGCQRKSQTILCPEGLNHHDFTLKQFREVSGGIKKKKQNKTELSYQLGVDSCAISGRCRAAETSGYQSHIMKGFWNVVIVRWTFAQASLSEQKISRILGEWGATKEMKTKVTFRTV